MVKFWQKCHRAGFILTGNLLYDHSIGSCGSTSLKHKPNKKEQEAVGMAREPWSCAGSWICEIGQVIILGKVQGDRPTPESQTWALNKVLSCPLADPSDN